jgi:hypothetical protein
MDLQYRLVFIIPNQQVRYLGGIAVHRPTGIDTPIAETSPAHILYRIEQAGFNDRESHKCCGFVVL